MKGDSLEDPLQLLSHFICTRCIIISACVSVTFLQFLFGTT